jgi:hypothetical protein
MPHPLADHIQGDAGGNGDNTKAVAKSLGVFVGAIGDVGLVHYIDDVAPGRSSGKLPQGQPQPVLFALGGLLQAVGHVQGIQQGVRYRYGPVNPCFPFFERLKDDGLLSKVDTFAGEGQGFRNPAAGIGHDHTKGSDFPVRSAGGIQKGVPFALGDIEALAVSIEQGGGHGAENSFETLLIKYCFKKGAQAQVLRNQEVPNFRDFLVSG